MTELVPYLNTALLLAILGYMVRLEHRITRIETQCVYCSPLSSTKKRSDSHGSDS